MSSLFLVLPGCKIAEKKLAAPSPNLTPTQAVPQIREPIQQSREEIAKARKAIEDAIAGIGDFKTTMVQALSHLDNAEASLKAAEVKVAVAETAVAEDVKQDQKREEIIAKVTKENTQLKQDDPVRGWLQLAGFAALAIGAGLGVASAVGWIKTMPLAIAVTAFGAVLVSLARFLSVIEWMVFGSVIAAVACGVLWAGWHVYRWLREEKTEAEAKP